MWTADQSKIITAAQKAAKKQAEARAAMLAAYKAAFDAHLDAVAQERQYDNRLTIPDYIASTNPQWAAEAQAYIAWRDQALVSMFGQWSAVEAGGDPPSIEDFIAELPAIEWPEA